MRYGLCSALLIAVLACDPALLRGQSNPLTPSLRTERANTVLGARIQWLEDTLPIDPCSILRATGDTGFVSRLDAEVRSQLLDRQVATPCTPLGGGSPVAHVELVSVTGTRDAAVITLLVHGRGIGSLLQRHRFDATNGWRIEIEFPVAQNDRAPRPAPPDTLRNDRAGLPSDSLTVADRSDRCSSCWLRGRGQLGVGRRSTKTPRG
jgi:hypothetical protein